MVEGTIGRLFGGGVRPVEIGHRIARAMSDSRSVGVRGQPVVANQFTVALTPDDLGRFSEVKESMVRELCDAARDHAKGEGWTFMGPVKVELVADTELRAGSFDVTARMKEADGGAGVLVLPTGEQIVLTEYLVTFGRLPECTISFDDSNVSRQHAEIRPEGDGFVLTDLGSTNGTKVNGARVTRHRLVDGDRITFGATDVEFRAG
jgi:FhaA, N-terminal domain/FHA domain